MSWLTHIVDSISTKTLIKPRKSASLQKTKFNQLLWELLPHRVRQHPNLPKSSSSPSQNITKIKSCSNSLDQTVTKKSMLSHQTNSRKIGPQKISPKVLVESKPSSRRETKRVAIRIMTKFRHSIKKGCRQGKMKRKCGCSNRKCCLG